MLISSVQDSILKKQYTHLEGGGGGGGGKRLKMAEVEGRREAEREEGGSLGR